MPIDADQLEAFEMVAKMGNFTAAAMRLGLTQPALSRRVQALEDRLKVSLFHRKPSGAELTQSGCRLLQYCEARGLLEAEALNDIQHQEPSKMTGLVRITGYTSALHTVVTPSIGSFLRAHPGVSVQYQAAQDARPQRRQFDMLLRAESDLLLTVSAFKNRYLSSHLLGYQKLVAVESTLYPKARANTYLDTRPEDPTTAEFFRQQGGTPPHYERSFLYDEEGILRAVAEGMGRAVVFSSLLSKDLPLRPVPGARAIRWPIYLVYRSQSHYLPAVSGIREEILKKGPRHLT